MLKKVKLGFLLGIIVGFIILLSIKGVSAYITRQRTLGASTVSTGTLDLTVTPAESLINVENIAPGFVSDENVVTLKNTGTIKLKYRFSAVPLQSSDNNDLMKALQVKVNVYKSDGTLKETLFSDVSKTLDEITNLEIDEQVEGKSSRKLGLVLSLPNDAGDEIAGLTTNFKLVFDAVQSDGVF